MPFMQSNLQTIFSLEGEMEIFLVITMYLDPYYLPTLQCIDLFEEFDG